MSTLLIILSVLATLSYFVVLTIIVVNQSKQFKYSEKVNSRDIFHHDHRLDELQERIYETSDILDQLINDLADMMPLDNKEAIADLKKSIDGVKSELIENKLKISGHEKRLDQLVERLDQDEAQVNDWISAIQDRFAEDGSWNFGTRMKEYDTKLANLREIIMHKDGLFYSVADHEQRLKELASTIDERLKGAERETTFTNPGQFSEGSW